MTECVPSTVVRFVGYRRPGGFRRRERTSLTILDGLVFQYDMTSISWSLNARANGTLAKARIAFSMLERSLVN